MRSLQARILALVLTLLVAVQAGVHLMIDTVGTTAARSTLDDELAAGARVLERLLEEEAQRLVLAARQASLASAHEPPSSANRNRVPDVPAQPRHDQDLVLLVGHDDRVVADTLNRYRGARFPEPEVLGRARLLGGTHALVILDGRLHQVGVAPARPSPHVAWVAVARELDDALLQDWRALTRLDTSLLWRPRDQPWRLQASTLPDAVRLPLLADVATWQAGGEGSDRIVTTGDDVVARAVRMSAGGETTAVALLQHASTSALAPFRRLQTRLAWASLLALVVSVIAAVLVVRTVVRPVRELAGAARRIAAGDAAPLPARRADPREIAELATAFRSMQQEILARQARIADLAYCDPLTRLPNRTLFNERLAQAVTAARASGAPVAVLVLDLDHFKYVNDALGHSNGDLLLVEVADRLRRVRVDEGAVVARLGGDEFALLLPGVTGDAMQAIAARLLATLETPMRPGDHVVDVRASVGAALHPDHGGDATTLLRHADVAMYAAKRRGGGFVVFDDRHDPHSRDRLALMRDLRNAVERDELALLYQPKVALTGAHGEHVEALLRWQCPSRGLVAPSEFVPFAESTGYIRTITQWVLDHAVRQCVAWRAEGLAMHVAVNLSARDVSDPQLAERIAALLSAHRCAPRWMAFEITESALLDDAGHAAANLERLHALGCRLAIDDYGTGYSSLAHLRRLPLDELKIDKSFVSRMAIDADDAAIVRSTIDLAHHMRLDVVAEGVEDEATLARLRGLGCDMAQGFVLSRPLLPAHVPGWYRGGTRAPSGSEDAAIRRAV